MEEIADNILFSRDGHIFGYLSIRAGDTKLLTEEERVAKGFNLASVMGVEREPRQLLSIPRTVDTAGMIERLAELRKTTREDARLKLLDGEISALQEMARDGSKEPLIVFKCWARAARGVDQELMKRLRDVRARLSGSGVSAELMSDTDITYLCKVFADLTSYHDTEQTAFTEEIPLLRGTARKLKADPETNAGLLNLITPVGGLSFGVSKTTIGGVVGRIYGAQRYPAELDYGWAVELMNSSDCITSATYLPGSAAELGDALSRSIKQNVTEADAERDARKRKRYERQALDADKLIESLDFNSAPIGHLTWLVMPFTDDEEHLEDTCRAVLNRYARKRIKLKVLGSVQRDAYKQLSPYYTNQSNVDDMMRRLIPLETLMGGSPMTVNIYRDANGVYFAKTMDGSIISLDFLYRGRDRTNGNIVAVGQAGGGKSTAMKSILESLYMQGVKVIAIDPEREFRDLCRSLHGTWLDVGGGTSKVNLFHVRAVPEDDAGEPASLYKSADNALALHMRNLEMVFKLYLPDLTSVQQSLLMKAVQDCYTARGIVWETDVRRVPAGQYPVAADLHRLLAERAAGDPRYESLEALTYSMAEGPDSFLLNGHTNVSLDSDFVVHTQVLVLLLFAVGIPFLLGVRLPKNGIRGEVARASEKVRQKRKPRRESAKEYVTRIDGKTKEGLFMRSRREARQVYERTGQEKRFGKTLRLSLLTGACGGIVGLMFKNILLAVVLAAGFYFLPLWTSQFSLYRYNRFLNEELETALSLITTSYTRTNDILGAVEENMKDINEPVKGVFAAFVNNLKYVDPNAPAQIERMKGALDNKIWRQWCDSLILCQSDHTLRATLLPIVNKFSDQKAQQEENETKMMMPLKNAVLMIGLVLSIIPLFRVINADGYANLVSTAFGQFSMVATAVVVLLTINKAIRRSKPIEFDV